MTTDSEELSNGKKRKRESEEASEPELESQSKRIKLEESPDGEEEVTDSVATTESRPEKGTSQLCPGHSVRTVAVYLIRMLLSLYSQWRRRSGIGEGGGNGNGHTIGPCK
jgi:hypothetical protein